MEIRQVNDDYAVSAQIAVDDITAIKEAGYRSIICNRPDDAAGPAKRSGD